MRRISLLTAIFCLGWTVKAQDTLKTVQLDDVVVTGTKSEVPIEKSGKSIFKITRKDIESSAGRSVADILNEVPGVQMDGNFGPLGTNVGYFIRGASSKRTLVLIDGVPFNDASGIDQTYDFRLLDLDQVESIEILKGGLSTLYGTGAAAGVINVQLKKPEEAQVAGSLGAEYGSFNTISFLGNVSGMTNGLSYLFSGSYKKSDGFSAALDDTGAGNFDDDGYEGYNFLGKVGYDFTEFFNLGVTVAYDAFDTDFDAGAFADSETNFSEYEQLRIGVSPSYKWADGNIKGNFFYSKLDRFFDSSGFISENNAENIQGDIVVDQNLTYKLKLVGGINYQSLAYSQPDLEEESFNMVDPYLTFIYDVNSFNAQVGGRLNIHSDYGTNFVYNINPSFLVGFDEFNLKLFSSYATSFITPSLFQLYGPFGANPELEPEESESVEGGLVFLGEKFDFNMVYFYRKDENLILFGAAYENSNEEIETDGLEFSGSYQVFQKLSLAGNYSYTQRLNDAVAFRIPTHKYGLSASYVPIDNLSAKLSYLHTGSRDLQYFDSSFNQVLVDAEAFNIVDLSLSYQWNSFVISGAINNLLDEEYQAIAGFTSVERNYNLGIRYNF